MTNGFSGKGRFKLPDITTAKIKSCPFMGSFYDESFLSSYNPKMRRSRESAPAPVKKRENAAASIMKSNSQPGDIFGLMKG